MKKTLRKILGVILVILGLAALLTPLTPGSWLALIGLELLGIRMLFERKLFLKGERQQKLIKLLRKAKLSRLADYVQKRSDKIKNPKSSNSSKNPNRSKN